MATFFNQATLTYNNNVINSNITSGEIQEVLSITKTAVPIPITSSSRRRSHRANSAISTRSKAV